MEVRQNNGKSKFVAAGVTGAGFFNKDNKLAEADPEPVVNDMEAQAAAKAAAIRELND